MPEPENAPTDLSLVPLDALLDELNRRYDTLVFLAERTTIAHPEDSAANWTHRCKGTPFAKLGLLRALQVIEEGVLQRVLARADEGEL